MYKFYHRRRRYSLLKVIREPGETRPLVLKNCDNKTIADTYNVACWRTLTSSISKLQRGVVSQRQLIHNVMSMDTYGRIFGRRGHCNFREYNTARQVHSTCIKSGTVKVQTRDRSKADFK